MNETVKQLEVIKEMADEKSVRQLCTILIEYINNKQKDENAVLGFTAKQKKE